MSHGMLLSIRDLTISTANKRLFGGLSFSVHRGEAVALIGPNGSGKTTLLSCIMAALPHAGRRIIETDDSILNHLTIEGKIAVAPGVLSVHLDQTNNSSLLTGEAASSQFRDHLQEIGRQFDLTIPAQDISALSAGKLQKLALARLLVRRADLYLLDEPSNFLDLPGIVALEYNIQKLKTQGAGILIVTHDRELSDRVCDHTVFLSPQGVYQTPGGASAALAFEEHDVQARAHLAATLQRKISQLEEDCRAKAGWARQKEQSKRGSGSAKGYISHRSAKMARRARAVQKRIDMKQEELKRAKPYVPKRVNLSLPQYEIPHRTVFRLEGCWFRYRQPTQEPNATWALSDISLCTATKDKLCLMGGNGAGKTTLLRLATGELAPTIGTAYRNASVRISTIPQGLSGYFCREHLLDNFAFQGVSELMVRKYLGAALLRRETVLRKTSELSQGELMRAALVREVVARTEFLVLDEPTSHLDLESITVLELLLSTFQGGFLIVSHDRAFVTRVAQRLYYLKEGRLQMI